MKNKVETKVDIHGIEREADNGKFVKGKVGGPGRTKIYTEEYMIALGKEYIDWLFEADENIFFTKFANAKGIPRDTWWEYYQPENPFFVTIQNQFQLIIEEKVASNMLFNKANVIGSIFFLKNKFKWVDKHEVITTNRNIQIQIVNPSPQSLAPSDVDYQLIEPQNQLDNQLSIDSEVIDDSQVIANKVSNDNDINNQVSNDDGIDSEVGDETVNSNDSITDNIVNKNNEVSSEPEDLTEA